MLFATVSVFAAMALSRAAGPNGRTFAVNHFYGKGPLTSGRMDPIVSPGVPLGHHYNRRLVAKLGLHVLSCQE